MAKHLNALKIATRMIFRISSCARNRQIHFKMHCPPLSLSKGAQGILERKLVHVAQALQDAWPFLILPKGRFVMRAFYISAVAALVSLASVGCQSSMTSSASAPSERAIDIAGAKGGGTVLLQSHDVSETFAAPLTAGHN
jgi:hypothetical protein